MRTIGDSCALSADSPQEVAQTGQQLAQEGMQRTLEHEREEWIIAALYGIWRFSKLPEWAEFKTEDFRAWWLSRGNAPPHDHHVWGSLTNRACKAGLIEWTGKYRPSVSPKTHGHPVKTWRSAFVLSPVAGISGASVQINERPKLEASDAV